MIAHPSTGDGPIRVMDRLLDATNRHDLDALVNCFAPDYLSELPLHPSRTFRGSDQVRRKWTQIFAAVPDLASVLVRSAVSGNEGWAEWEWTGTRRDGAAHLMRGITILGVVDGRIGWARFYMEPVLDDGVAIDDAMRTAMSGSTLEGAIR